MNTNNVEELKQVGFEGFKTISELFLNQSNIPNERGVYLVLYNSSDKPKFLSKGVGGFFKGKNPNVSIAALNTNWIDNAIIIYIGQAGGIRKGKWSDATLSKRLSAYMKFGQGQDIGHYGGRLIWQIEDYKNLVVCWKSFPNKSMDPKVYEDELLTNFKNDFGNRPFANLLG